MREIGAMREECQLAVPVGKKGLVAESQRERNAGTQGEGGRREASEKHPKRK
jgi:hypothetical protein